MRGRVNTTHDDPSGKPVLAGLGAMLLVLVCCAAPALIAAGVLGVVGSWLTGSIVLGGLAVLVMAGGAITMVRRRGRGTRC
jgi:hypothetical protein